MSSTRIRLEGLKFHHLAVVKYVGDGKYECLCDCGKKTCVRSFELRNGATKSCGCKTIEMRLATYAANRDGRKEEFTVARRATPPPRKVEPDYS